MPRLYLIVFAAFLAVEAGAQPAADTTRADTTFHMAPVVVTATRTERELKDVAVPTAVVPAERIREQGALRLSDVLEEVTGLALFDDHGTGVQVQGFSPDYTLILIDGAPVIGRTAGTLDLDRLPVAGLSRVEIVRGPSSSLYGSEALAGVINLITRPPGVGRAATAGVRYGTHQTTDLSASVEGGGDTAGARLLVNRYSTTGYDLRPDVLGPTTPQFTDYTADLRLRFEPGGRLALKLGGRMAVQDQESMFALDEGGTLAPHDQTDGRLDWSVHPELRYRFSSRLFATGTVYVAHHRSDTRMTRQSDGALYYADHFDQQYARPEVQLDAIWNARHLTSGGGGYVFERLGGDRYTDAQPEARSVFAFAQHAWMPGRRLELNVSARFDAHSDYAARLSPRLALLVRPSERLRLRASVGSGFKAPDVRQLYLTFSNAAAGYSVLGSTEVVAGLQRLEAEGQLAEVFLDPGALETIRAENSVAFNLGFSAEPVRGVSVEANAFHNDVHDLIETQPIAQKTNGSFVYSYFNLNRIYTQGLEAEVSFEPGGAFSVSAGYQFLRAHDRAVLERVRAGEVFGRREDGRDYRLGPGDYSGLFGRSPHSGTVRALYRDVRRGLALSVRGVWRSRYGYRDLDGNSFANRADEFVPGYVLWHATLTSEWDVPFAGRLTLQLGVENLADVRKPTLIPSLPGRTAFAGVTLGL